ncbi:MAG: DUF547 domain-containing protein [Planctomycetota bacterium]|jgi:hypothetical protein
MLRKGVDMFAGINKCLMISTFIVSTIFCIEALSAEQNNEAFNYDDYAEVLKSYVDNKGMVNYKQLKANRAKLDSFARQLSKLDDQTYKKWSNNDKIAFWINAYNGLTLKAIIDNYPIKSSFLKSRIYPKNSIRQISGVWDKKKHKVMGSDRTLEHIEHEILRKKFNEPGIHVALVCAAMGCPPLLNKPYVGDKLEEQFDDRTRRFLSDSKKFNVDRKGRKVLLSPIFKWFGSDFVGKYSMEKTLPRLSKNQTAVINYISRILEKDDGDYLLKGNFKIKYLDYDWSLNEQ